MMVGQTHVTGYSHIMPLPQKLVMMQLARLGGSSWRKAVEAAAAAAGQRQAWSSSTRAHCSE
jgi:hypothetical protein